MRRVSPRPEATMPPERMWAWLWFVLTLLFFTGFVILVGQREGWW